MRLIEGGNIIVSMVKMRLKDPGRLIVSSSNGFTIVELLVVIVVIGILAAITIISYSGIRQKADIATLQSDLKNASTQLELDKAKDDSYPDSKESANDNQGLKASPMTELTYTSNNSSYCLVATINDLTYYIDSNTKQITSGACTPIITCDDLDGFILVPGDSTYGTTDFCVMAYEAKADDNDDGIGDTTHATTYHSTWPADSYPISESRKLVSTPQGWPVALIDQDTAKTVAENYTKDCDIGCHLITEAEWMTIAKNVLSNPENWNSGVVGTGYVYSGHNDAGGSSGSLAALQITDIDDGYNGTGNFAGDNSVTNTMVGDSQRRTLELTNGEIIWDLAGNVWEWTSNSQTGGWPAGMSGYNWYEWTSITSQGSLLVNPRPSGTGIAGSNVWNSDNGIGVAYGVSSDTSLRGFLRGGDKSSYEYWAPEYGTVGVLTLSLHYAPSLSQANTGLRVAR
ncbi:MAG: prepilin-type N-terminal cleavage/methylation domain-containing protein [Candidatus Cloacimonetes bacterium]|nr:prepilin-type N-terminal cleavage/methylation domain-containing protein [Candidatus Cloacimonadota bacterium]